MNKDYLIQKRNIFDKLRLNILLNEDINIFHEGSGALDSFARSVFNSIKGFVTGTQTTGTGDTVKTTVFNSATQATDAFKDIFNKTFTNINKTQLNDLFTDKIIKNISNSGNITDSAKNITSIVTNLKNFDLSDAKIDLEKGKQLLESLGMDATKITDNDALKATLKPLQDKVKDLDITNLGNSFTKINDTVSQGIAGWFPPDIAKQIRDNGNVVTAALVAAGCLGTYYLYKKWKKSKKIDADSLQYAQKLNNVDISNIPQNQRNQMVSF